MFTTAVLRVGDDWLAWFGCHGKPGAIYLTKPSESVSGAEILSWITCYTDPRVLLRLAFDVCYAGRGLLGLPWYVNSESELVSSGKSLEWNNMPSVLCISACTDDQKAHTVKLKDGTRHGGLLCYILDLFDQDRKGHSCAVTEIQRELSPCLSKKREDGRGEDERGEDGNGEDGKGEDGKGEDEWEQTPEVSMTHLNADARFWIWGPRS